MSGTSFEFLKLVPNNQEENHSDWPKNPCDQDREYYKKWQENETSVWKVPCENFEVHLLRYGKYLLLQIRIIPNRKMFKNCF